MIVILTTPLRQSNPVEGSDNDSTGDESNNNNNAEGELQDNGDFDLETSMGFEY